MKIISLVPSQTELLFDMGLEDSIVGITKFCVHPGHLRKSKKIVGGTKNINIDKIKALGPDIILCNKEENTKAIVEQCEQVATTHVSDIFTIDDTFNLINHYGALFSCREIAEKIIEKITRNLDEFNLFIKDREVLKAAYFIWRNPWMVAADQTFINHVLSLNKFENIYKDKKRYPEVALESMKSEGDPDLIFLSSEPYPFKEKHIVEIEQFVQHKNIVLVDGEYFSWYGSRLMKAFDYFKELRLKIEEII